ncbi:MAG: box helicase [Burkholderia sp.]|jgi:ATP-dependent RNA helicase DeaD|nr:box helicase [Burkholderia sp.]
MSETPFPLFAELNLGEPILRVLNELGYETPSPIQAATIPLLMENRDVLGQAQTGTGKTAAFALPILARIDIRQSAPQALVLAPTRELAIQVAEAFQRYATHIPGFHVLPIYGGQSYGPQLSALRRGVHVVVGTPGRVIDHLEKNSLDLSQVKTLVLDEADEMLRMGFIDDVETILQKTPASRQTALFSATMPSAIRRIAQTYLRSPEQVTIAAKTGTAENIRQRYWLVSGMQKLDALTRILEAETFDGMIIFARTKLGTEELAGKLQARGFSAAAINGDINQQQRERTIQMLKDGKIDILVATDVAARGLDVERISHVVNYDVPHDPESYTHRIGRTGRAGRSGEAILFITPREKGLLRVIERATRQPVAPLTLPTIEAVNDVRIARFKDQIADTLAAGGLDIYRSLIEDYERERNVPAVEIAAALASLARGDVPLLLEKPRREPQPERFASEDRPARFERPERSERFERSERPASPRPERNERTERPSDAGMARYRIEVGAMHGVKPGNIVGAIANEAGMDGKNIGRIDINDDHTLLDMPEGLPEDIVNKLKGVRISGRQLHLSRAGEQLATPAAVPAREPSPRTERPAPAAPREPSPRTERPAPVEAREPSPRTERAPRAEAPERDAPTRKDRKPKSDIGMERYRIEVGSAHGVKPANIVGAIANEAGLDAKYIGHIEILDDHSVLDLPEGMPKELLQHLKTVWVAGQQLRISHADGPPAAAKPASGKITLTVPKRGAERRVEDKKAGAKTHRKGGKAK